MRPSVRQRVLAILAACCAATPALADSAASPAGEYRATTPVVGGLSLVPERWRYRPAPTPVALVESERAPAVDSTPVSRLRSRTGLLTLENDYVPDRQSFVNTVRARRSLSLLTLWEGAGRCLFLGVNDRGRAGINFVPVRAAKRERATLSPTHALYDELTGNTRGTFPEPPRLFQH